MGFLAFIVIKIIIIIIMTMNRMIKKAALGGPSSDETFPLRVLSFTQHNYPARMRKG